MLDEKGVID